jgi:cytoskeletal protein RodZ
MQLRRHGPEPVFVDRTGRRRRLFAAAGAAGGVLLALASLVLVAGFTGAGAGYLPALPEPAGSKAHSAVSTASPSATTRSAGPSPAPATPGREDRTTTASVPPATTTPPTSVTPSPTHTNNRNVPTHTPSHKPSK